MVDPVAAETVDEKVPVPVTLKLPDANVPVVVKFSLPNVIAPDESVILPFANVKFPMVDPVAAETVDEKVPVPVILKLPEANVPVVVKFSSPNEIAPDESVILPFASVKSPIVEPVAAETVDEKVPVPVIFKLPDANVPVVVKFSLPNEIAPDESVILPFANVKFPIVEPVAADIVDVNVEASSAVIAPTLIDA